MEIAPPPAFSPHCSQCTIQSRCLPARLNPQDIPAFDTIVNHGRILATGRHAFMSGDSFRAIFMVRQGTVKTYTVTEDGEEQVTGFFTTADCFGFDGINIGKHTNSARALVRTQLCEIPFEALEQLCARIPKLQHYAFQLASHQILQEQKRMHMMGKQTAEARVAFLLLDYITRYNHAQPSIHAAVLPMTRYDIANYLGLSVETVSRVLSRLQAKGIIQLKGRAVNILSLTGLQACNHHHEESTATAQRISLS